MIVTTLGDHFFWSVSCSHLVDGCPDEVHPVKVKDVQSMERGTLDAPMIVLFNSNRNLRNRLAFRLLTRFLPFYSRRNFQARRNYHQMKYPPL